MPSRRKQPQEPCGSGQSSASLAADKAAQPRLLASAAARKAGSPTFKSTIAKKPKSTGKKLIDLSKLVSPSTSASSSKDKTYKVQKAVFSLVRATYQKGDKKDQYSGADQHVHAVCYLLLQTRHLIDIVKKKRDEEDRRGKGKAAKPPRSLTAAE